MLKKSVAILTVLLLLFSFSFAVMAEDTSEEDTKDNSAEKEETEDGMKIYTKTKTDDKAGDNPDDSGYDNSKALNNPLYVAGS